MSKSMCLQCRHRSKVTFFAERKTTSPTVIISPGPGWGAAQSPAGMTVFADTIDTQDVNTSEAVPAVVLGRCLGCDASSRGGARVGRSYPEVEGIVHAIGRLSGTNRIAAKFYDGPCWARFRPWEQLFLWFQGARAARRGGRSSRHLPDVVERARVLEVGIGSGANLPLLPPRWAVYGVDIARSQLAALPRRVPGHGRPPGMGRGRGASLRGRDVRRRLFGRRVQLLP